MNSLRSRLCFLPIIVAAACSNHNDGGTIAYKTPKLVPAFFVAAASRQLYRSQDTVLYDNKPFSGHVFALYPTGDSALQIPYLNGLQEGTCRKWYPNKQLLEERQYVDGKKEGLQKAWWGNGMPKFAFEASNDEYCGFFKEWYSSGQLARDFNYKNGHEQGSEKMWWPNGAVRANYVIKKGKKYGSMGIKLCINPYDSLNKK